MGPSSQATTDRIEEAFEAPPQSLDALAKAVSRGRTAMVYESPPLGKNARAAGFLDIRGWAYSHAGLDAVSVYLDGLRYEARLGVARPDLDGLDGLFGVDLTSSGFDLTIELDADQVGRLTVTVVARGAGGHAVGVRGTVDCRPEPASCTVAAATDGKLPGTGTPASIDGPLEERSWQDLVRSLQERVLVAEAQAAASAADARAARARSGRALARRALRTLREVTRRAATRTISYRRRLARCSRS